MNYNNIIFLMAICFALNLAAMQGQEYYFAPNNDRPISSWENYGDDSNEIIPLYPSYNLSLAEKLMYRRMDVLEKFLHTHGIEEGVTLWGFFDQMHNQNENDWRLQYHKTSHNLSSPPGFQDMVIKELERCGISPSRITLQYNATLKGRFFDVISPAFSINQQGKRIAHPGLIAFSLPVFKQLYHTSKGSEFLRAITLYAIAQLKSEITIFTHALKTVFYKYGRQLDTRFLCSLQKELHNIAILDAASKDAVMAEYFNKYFSWSSHNTFSPSDIELLQEILNTWNTPTNAVNDNQFFLNDIF